MMSFGLPPRPYPPVRYTQAQPQISATGRPESTPHDITMRSGAVDYLATGDMTNGDYGLYRWHFNSEFGGPAPHFHRALTESFFVLAGVVDIYDGRRWQPSLPGDFVFIPEGGVHGFRNSSGAPASMLILFTPGAPRESYFEGLAELAERPRPSEADMTEFYLSHDNHWL